MDSMKYFIIVIFSLMSGWLGGWVIQKYGYNLGIIDVPNERSSHEYIVPKGGGIGILAAFVFSSFVLDIPKTFWISGIVLALVSFVGDRLDIRPKIRLMIQFGCVLVFIIDFMVMHHGPVELYLLIFPLVIFIVGTANFYNFMDGINGIAGITGGVGFMLLACYGTLEGMAPYYVTLSLSIAFACAGFLPLNVPKAKVFMGDVGSVMLGFVFACVVIMMSRNLLDFICMAALIFPFYADELTTMVVRIREGDDLINPHRKHLYQLLANEYGLEHWKVSVGYGVCQVFIGLALIGLKPHGYSVVMIFLAVCLLWFSIISFYVRRKLNPQITQIGAD